MKEFQLGHVFSDMDCGALQGAKIEYGGEVSIGPRLFRHGLCLA